MSTRVAVFHQSRYRYDRPVTLEPHVVRLRPAAHAKASIVAYSQRVAPSEHFVNWQQDPTGNFLARYVFPKPASELDITVELVVDITAINPFDFFLAESAETFPFSYDPYLASELEPYLVVPDTGARFEQWTRRVRDDVVRPGKRTIDVLVELNQLLSRTLRYDIRMEPGVFTPDETLERGHGSCRDFAWLMVATLRAFGLAARFVSGYSIQLVADQKPIEGPVGVSADCVDLHAWAEVFLPGAGYVGLDATSGLLCGEGHVPLASTADPVNAAPVTGSFLFTQHHDDDNVEERFEVTMTVTRLRDDPRPTKPFTDEAWQALLACGDAVDERLRKGDMRLTMGGEPTFVGIDEPDAPEWNTTALGAEKQRIADGLVRKLQKRFAPGGLLHHGQGKWYPGEPLPRWAYSCYFRRDGEPIWREPSLLADGRGREQANAERASTFARELIGRLGLTTEHLQAAHEDAFYYLWRERRLPFNVDPFDNKLDDELERARIGRVFRQGLAAVVGYALPLRALESGRGTYEWQTGRWFVRDERLLLLPGDSAMGFRLPLDSLPWVEERELEFARDPFDPRPALPKHSALRAPRMQRLGEPNVPRRDKPLPEGTVRTALCFEPRGGTLHVFMPPLTSLEAYLELCAHLEDTASALRLPVRIEGYHPPSDPRITRLQVTPDPGVIEVNVQPASSWREVVAITTGLYEDALESRLRGDRFLLDGRQAGSGGGNHIALGGATAADSPFLRRPDLLRSLLAYSVNHPSLSYLFSGLFVGPTSQAPRIDEARQDSIYELEIALDALDRAGNNSPPWFVDRVLRNLLTDVTGNTHRTELCIDKLYDPDTPTGRQGLVELRAFEMTPDARMTCAQQLLVRALLASFWEKPYKHPPVRWGTALHDRHLLPYFVWRDFQEVLGDLARAGLALDPKWYLPQWELRFPLAGRTEVDDVELELRHAIEPWHVLGEEHAAAGTTRYVDSSAERVQLRVQNLVPSRHVLAVNGRRIPLHSTHVPGEQIAGVRFRAWRPDSALHPTLPLDAPLVFDLIDTWNDRVIGGCTYHVGHPGGRAYDVFPRNALEAESRRVARFWPMGHTPGPASPPAIEPRDEIPLTLDLRRPRT